MNRKKTRKSERIVRAKEPLIKLLERIKFSFWNNWNECLARADIHGTETDSKKMEDVERNQREMYLK